MREQTLKRVPACVFGIALVTAMFGAGHLAMAADGGPRGPDMERLSQELSLTQEQAREMERILEQSRERRREVVNEYRGSGNREAARNEMEALRRDTDRQLSGVLNEQQLERLQTRRMERKAEWQSRREGVRGDGRGGERGHRPRGSGR